MQALTNPDHHFTCLSTLDQEIWERERKELQPRLADYLAADGFRFYPPSTLLCPKCGSSAYLYHAESWCCPQCGEGGDILDAAFFRTNSLEYSKNISRIQMILEQPPAVRVYSASGLMDVTFQPSEPLIEGLLYPGLYLLAGAPKLGKSWLVMQLAQRISLGQPLWNLKTSQTEVLYFALEDTLQRLQERMVLVCGSKPGAIYLATTAGSLGKGLEEQIESFVSDGPNRRLVIIDTLQKVREVVGDQYSYAKDYETMQKLKVLADRLDIAILVVHHTRKQEASDSFDKISGTQGLMGCADGAWILEKQTRQEDSAVLKSTGRQSPDLVLNLALNRQNMCWELDANSRQTYTRREDPLLNALRDLILDEGAFHGNCTELSEKLKLRGQSIEPNILGRKLNGSVSILYTQYGLIYEARRNAKGRFLDIQAIAERAAPLSLPLL